MGFLIRPPQEDTLTEYLAEDEPIRIGPKKLCPCGKTFTPYRSFQRYHNDACRVSQEAKRPSRYIKRRIEDRTCPVCSIVFKTNDGKRTYCSHKCYLKHEEQRRVPGEERACLICGTKFVTAHWAKRYCSTTCRREARK